MSLMVRRRRNKIVAIKDGPSWIHTNEGRSDYFLDKFQELFRLGFPTIPVNMDGLGQNLISKAENKAIIEIPSKAEIKRCIEAFHPLKSPSPNGFSGIFYRSYWDTVREHIVKFTQKCFRLKKVPHGVNRTFLVLIPKTRHLTNFNHFRPISLRNFAYKIISKILMERLKKLLGRIVLLNQGAFVKG